MPYTDSFDFDDEALKQAIFLLQMGIPLTKLANYFNTSTGVLKRRILAKLTVMPLPFSIEEILKQYYGN